MTKTKKDNSGKEQSQKGQFWIGESENINSEKKKRGHFCKMKIDTNDSYETKILKKDSSERTTLRKDNTEQE